MPLFITLALVDESLTVNNLALDKHILFTVPVTVTFSVGPQTICDAGEGTFAQLIFLLEILTGLVRVGRCGRRFSCSGCGGRVGTDGRASRSEGCHGHHAELLESKR